MMSLAPAACKPWAMPQAMLRLLATPKTTAVRPFMLNDIRERSAGLRCQQQRTTILMNFAGNGKLNDLARDSEVRALYLSYRPAGEQECKYVGSANDGKSKDQPECVRHMARGQAEQDLQHRTTKIVSVLHASHEVCWD